VRLAGLLGLALWLLLGMAKAGAADKDFQDVQADDSDLDVVLVMGEQRGPGLWKVVSGDHVMWILGEVSPIPRKVKWRSRKFDTLLRQSQELIVDFSGYWPATADEMSAYRKAEKLPKGKTLEDVIPEKLYPRVAATAKLFDVTELEDLYPFAATNRLVIGSMKYLDLKGFSARFAALDLAKRREIKATVYAAPEPPFETRLTTWQNDANWVCLKGVVDVLHDGGTGLKRLANAWSVGDIATLRELVRTYSFSRDGFRSDACAAAMRGGEKQASDFETERKQGWMKEAERALKDNQSTMAVTLMTDLFAADGYIAQLRARGYEVVEPE
jgi:hypothetical protein